ncbi:hypothetical protein [Streptomyces sp. Tu 2975]|uniref:hypothetical protein n=1 Tax=Streptomyces sp. Tu 2975 TaxID=2676871 RepID=UPI001FC9CCC3|nr:hypothetical protein [Streptomyces sp. Tu 2975]
MSGRALVEGDELVCFRTRQVAAPTKEVVQAVPLCAVGCHEDIEVHGRLLLQALGALRTVRTTSLLHYCDALAVSLADWGIKGQGRPTERDDRGQQ